MDQDAERQKLEDSKLWIQQYLEHPLSVAIFQDNAEEQEKAVELLCNVPIHNLETLIGHFEARGHLRGLRRAKGQVMDKLEEVKDKLKELETNE